MEFQKIGQTTGTLYLIKESLFDPEYLLTDHTANFGKLIYDSLELEMGTAYIAGKSWKFDYDFEPIGKREVLIYDESNNLLGNVIRGYGYLSNPPVLIMTNGLKATFSDVAAFSSECEWISAELGRLIHIKSPVFSLTDTITIIRKDMPADTIALLCFLAEHMLILLRRNSRTHSF
ncbi:hypothetical protein [Mucilaginibacter sp. 22184]|uniref:hypothetical protein n=1 Tax=Mucilaginibacter sp. 22184 TaxID=3453887 RepID=UPI003F87BA21